MRDLVRESGLPRETIHFYMQQGLLPKAHKTGRNTALYTQDHLERLRRIRELQERQFLPLKAIRAILDDTADEGFTPEQEDLVRRVRATLGGWVTAQQSPAVAVSDFVPGRVPRQELKELIASGLVQVHGRADSATLSEDDAVILECWAQFKEAGLSPDRGVGPAEFELYDSAMEQLVRREARLALRAYSGATVDELSRVVEQTAERHAPQTASAVPCRGRPGRLNGRQTHDALARQATDCIVFIYTLFSPDSRHVQGRRLRPSMVRRAGPDVRGPHAECPLGQRRAASGAARAARGRSRR
jgi:DNA-binding transcriptional MerR regulator